MKADFVIASKSIFNGYDATPFAGYIAVKDGRIISVEKGTLSEEDRRDIQNYLDIGDKTITPAFTDVHCFFTGYAVHFVGADLSPATTIDEMLSIVVDFSDSLSPDKVILGHGLSEKLISEVNTERLEKTFGHRPVVLFAQGCETCLMNTAARVMYNFSPDTCYPESYVRLLRTIMSDRTYIVPLFKRYMRMMNRMGVTNVKEMGFDDFFGFTDILEELDNKNELTLRVHFMSQPVDKPMSLEYGKAMRDRFKGEFIRFSGFNRMTDGSVSELCADLKEPYLCADTHCAQEIDWEKIAEDTRKADSEGFRFSLHAQGDAAISKVLDIYESCKRNHDGKLINRHSITDLEFSDPSDLERMGKLGVIAEIYPQIQSIANRKDKLAMIKEKIGPERGTRYWNRRKMADSSVTISCGTDLPLLIDNIPESIFHAVGGFFPDGGEAFNSQNMLKCSELLRAWTYGGAYNLGIGEELGTLEQGKKADFVVFDDNLFDTPITEIRKRYVEQTYLNGKRIY